MSEMGIVSDASDADAEEDSVKKICPFLLTVFADGFGPFWGVDLDPGIGGGRIQGNLVLRKSVLIFLTVFADVFGPPAEWIWIPGWERVGSRGK